MALQTDANRIDYDDNVQVYETDVDGLRMATTYTFEVHPLKESTSREDRSDGVVKSENMIVIPTKGCK